MYEPLVTYYYIRKFLIATEILTKIDFVFFFHSKSDCFSLARLNSLE
jgi:hypothetical protein